MAYSFEPATDVERPMDFSWILPLLPKYRRMQQSLWDQEKQRRLQEAEQHALGIQAKKAELAKMTAEAQQMQHEGALAEAKRRGEEALLMTPGATAGVPSPAPLPMLKMGPAPEPGAPAPVEPEQGLPTAAPPPEPMQVPGIESLGIAGRSVSPVGEALRARLAQRAAMKTAFEAEQQKGLAGGHLTRLPTGEIVPTVLATTMIKTDKTKLTHVDLGDRIGWADEQGNVVKSVKKGAAPKAAGTEGGVDFSDEVRASPLTSTPFISAATARTKQEKEQLRSWAKQSGVRVLDKDNAGALQEISGAHSDLLSAWDSVKSQLPSNVFGTYSNRLLAAIQFGDEGAALKSYNDTVADYAVRVMRATAGKTGLRIQRDILEKIINSVPNPTRDTAATAALKMKRINTYMKNVEDSILGGQSTSSAGGARVGGATQGIIDLGGGITAREVTK